MSYYINPDAILDNSIKESSLPVKVQEKVDLYHINKQKPVIVGRAIPEKPEEGNKYYFADGFIKLKTYTRKEGFVYFLPYGTNPVIITIPKKNSREYQELIESLNYIFTHKWENAQLENNETQDNNLANALSLITNLAMRSNRASLCTRSPFITVVNGKPVYNKPITILSVDYVEYNPQSTTFENAKVYHNKKYNNEGLISRPIYAIHINKQKCQIYVFIKNRGYASSKFTDYRRFKLESYKKCKKFRKETDSTLSREYIGISNRGRYFMVAPVFRGKILKNNALYYKKYFYGSLEYGVVKEFMVLNKKPKKDRYYFG
jgi:hypothetical protein